MSCEVMLTTPNFFLIDSNSKETKNATVAIYLPQTGSDGYLFMEQGNPPHERCAIVLALRS